jgi:hypothetical protein
MAMNLLRDRRVIVIGGGALALVAGLAIAWFIFSRSHKPTEAPPASQGGLTVVSGRDDDAKLDPKRPLRCFVGGQFVGELPLAVCAQRNGVATGALDVGLDQAGALAATNGVNSTLTPLTPPPATSLPVVEQAPPDESGGEAAPNAQVQANASQGQAACWRFGGAGWRQLPAPLPLQLCVQALYAGRCPSSDDAFYGRWGDQTLRLSDGRVEISPNNRDFTPLVDPWPPCRVDQG